jgi:acetyl esterase/lipase
MLDLAAPKNMVVVSVEYRLAPEHPDPAPVEDCYAGLVWVADNADELGIDPDRLVVGGFSAGGGLTAGVTLLARDRGGPQIFAQMVLWPMLDDRNDTPSSFQMLGVGMWDQISNQTGWDALLGDRRGRPDVSPYAAPARADDLSGLPPTLIEVGSAETFRDEAVDYAMRIWQAGGIADLHVFAGAYHGYTMLAPDAAVSRDTVQVRSNWLYRLMSAYEEANSA